MNPPSEFVSIGQLVVGVTGHRDLRAEDIHGLELAVSTILQDLRASNPSLSLTILSPLAEGADRLVARVSLKFNAQLVVPLPLDQAAYEKDFQSMESLAEFRRLLSHATQVFLVESTPDLPFHPCSPELGVREYRYALAGVYVAHYSNILLALWDGRQNRRPGGTADIVRFRQSGTHQLLGTPREPVGNSFAMECIQIVTPRVSNPTPDLIPFSVQRLPAKAH